MSDQDPYQHDPYRDDPYTSDPYAPGDAYPSQPRPSDPTDPIPLNTPAPPPAAQPYGPHGYAYPPPAYYPQPQPTNVSALILTILSAVLALSCYCTLPGIVSLVFGIIALTKQSTDPAGSAKLAKYGWIAFAALMVVSIIAWVAFFALVVAADSSTY